MATSPEAAPFLTNRPKRPTRGLPPTPETNESNQSLTAPSISPSSPTPESQSTDIASTLTPLRAHYLKKTLIALQFRKELSLLSELPTTVPDVSTLSYLGPPFNPPPKSAPAVDLPFTTFMFRQFVLTFPFLQTAPRDFFPSKLQPFAVSLLSRNLSFADNPLGDEGEETEAHARDKILQKLEKHFAFILSSATKLVEKEDVVRLTQADLQRIEILSRKRKQRKHKSKDAFDVNVICVRSVIEKGRVRSRAHEEFVIRTRRYHQPDIFVSRRYGDFKTLANELRKAHPDELVRPPPPKDKTIVSMPTSSPSARSALSVYGSSESFPNGSSDSTPMSPPQRPYSGLFAAARLAREKNRLTLRSYLHALLANPVLGSSPVLRSFLTATPIVLNKSEEADAKRREEADRVRDEGRKQFTLEIANRVEHLRDALKQVKGEMMDKDGLTGVFSVVKMYHSIADLPPEYQAVIEWARTSLASTIFQNFVASDSSSENLASLKRIHGLMPYILLKTILRISNPVGMIRAALDLFLAQPFGGRSLLQRMFSSSLTEEVKALEEDINAVKDKIDDPVICEKLRLFIYAPTQIQEIYRHDAALDNLNILTCILRSGEQPVLSRAQLQRVLRAHRAHAEYLKHRKTLVDSDDDDGPPSDEAWLYEDLKVLAKLYARLRDREQLIALIFEGTTSEVLKDILTIFYSPLAQVYKAASIADSIGDFQQFISDLIKTVEQLEETSQEDAPKTVQAFLDLVQRHEQAFYFFVHKVHTKGEALFNSLIRWIELFLAFMREGLGDPLSLEFILPHSGPQRTSILSELDQVAGYHYKTKVAYEEKLQRRFGKQAGDSGKDDELAAAIVNDAVQDLSFGDLVGGDAQDLAEDATSEESESETESDSSEESESTSGDTSDNEPAPTAHINESTAGGVTEGLPLRITKSMTFSSSGSVKTAYSDLPPLPNSLQETRTPSPIPPPLPPKNTDPRRRATIAHHRDAADLRRRQSDLMMSHVPQTSARYQRRKIAAGPQYPELETLPELLPLFVELLRPQLERRAL